MLLIFLSPARVVRGNADGSSQRIGDVTLRGAGELGGSPRTQTPRSPQLTLQHRRPSGRARTLCSWTAAPLLMELQAMCQPGV